MTLGGKTVLCLVCINPFTVMYCCTLESSYSSFQGKVRYIHIIALRVKNNGFSLDHMIMLTIKLKKLK